MKHQGIVEQMKLMTPEQRSELARHDSMAKAKKEGENSINNLKIESGNELPPKSRNTGLESNDFFDKFNIGDNSYIPNAKLYRKLYLAAVYYGKKHNKTFTSRSQVIDGKKIYSIWRIK